MATRAWNLMGGELNWAALPIVAEILGIIDIEDLVTRVSAIRDWHRNQEN